MLEYIIPAVATVIIAIIEACAFRDRKKIKRDLNSSEKRAALRAEESLLSMRMMDTAISLGVATAIALEEHKVNGEMTEAKLKAQKAQRDYQTFLRRIAAGQVTNFE